MTRWILGAACVVVAWLVWWGLRQEPTDAPEQGKSISVEKQAVTPSAPAPDPVRRATSDSTPLLYEAPWGPDSLGRAPADESNPEGPMGFALGPDGSLWILDQVNGRLLRLRPGQPKPETLRISLLAPQDLKVAADGTVVVLDRLGDRAVALIGPDGQPAGTLSLAKLRDTGGITGVFTDGDEVFVEREHGALTHVGNTKGAAADVPRQLMGRPAPDGSVFLNASLSERSGVVVSAFDRKTEAQRFTRIINYTEPIQYLLELDADRAGTLYVATVIGIPGASHIVVTCLSLADGHSLGRVDLPTSTLPDEVFREIAVDPDGGFVHVARSESGARYERHACAP